MSNPIKKELDRISIANDISEREKIIEYFQATGFIDRNDAIGKIKSIQITDRELAKATIAKQIQCGTVDLYQVDNNVIVTNMQFQIDFLKAKLAKLESEDKDDGKE